MKSIKLENDTDMISDAMDDLVESSEDDDTKSSTTSSEVYQVETSKSSKRLITYAKLVVPSSMRSKYWKYFGFPADEDGFITTKDVVCCTLCKAQMVYNRNTSNLKMHLSSRHKNALFKIEENPPRSEVSTIDSSGVKIETDAGRNFAMDAKNLTYFVSEEIEEPDMSNITVILQNDDEVIECREAVNTAETQDIDEHILRYLVLDLVSPDGIDGKGICSLVTKLSTKPVTRQTKKEFGEIIPNVAKAYKEQLRESVAFGSAENLSISIEEWISADNVQCLSFFAHCLRNGETNLSTTLLTTVCCTGWEGILFWRDFLESLFNEWSIDCRNISAVLVAFSDEKLKNAIGSQNLIMIPCFLHLTQTFCNECFLTRPEVKELLGTSRNVVGTVIREAGELGCTDQDDEEAVPVDFDRPGLWVTTLRMLRSLNTRKSSLIEFYKTSFTKNPLTDNYWAQLVDVLQILKSLEMILSTFIEGDAVISLIKPLIWKMSVSQFKDDASDSILLAELKSSFRSFVTQAYCDSKVDNFLELSMSLDPRFKSFDYSTYFNYEEALITLLVQHLGDESSVVEKTRNQNKAPAPKRSRLSSLTAIFGGSSETNEEISIEERAKTEVSNYRKESSAFLEENPFEWWQHMTSKCPNLLKLSRKYLCLPVTVISNRFINLDDYVAFHCKRASLRYSCADALLFLHINKCLD